MPFQTDAEIILEALDRYYQESVAKEKPAITQPPMAEWGSMLGQERNQIFSAPHLVFFPGMAIIICVLGFNLLGDGLRDALDPRLARTDLGAGG